MATKAKSTTEINAKLDKVMDALEEYITILIEDNNPEVGNWGPISRETIKGVHTNLKRALKDVLYGV